MSVTDLRPVVVLEPRRGWQGLGLSDLWAHRGLLLALALRDVRTRYKQTALGVLWALIRPVTTMVVFTLLFGRLAGIPSDGAPYALFAYAGLLPWTFFATSVSTAAASLVNASALVTKVWFPRVLLPISSVGAATLDFAVSVLVLVPLMAHSDVAPTARLLAVPAVMLWVAVAALGIGTLLSALVVRWRDFLHATPFLLQVGLFATPVVYPMSVVAPAWRAVAYVNPMAGPVELFRWCVLASPVSPSGLLLSAASGAVLLFAGLLAFQRLERRFADVI